MPSDGVDYPRAVLERHRSVVVVVVVAHAGGAAHPHPQVEVGVRVFAAERVPEDGEDAVEARARFFAAATKGKP